MGRDLGEDDKDAGLFGYFGTITRTLEIDRVKGVEKA